MDLMLYANVSYSLCEDSLFCEGPRFSSKDSSKSSLSSLRFMSLDIFFVLERRLRTKMMTTAATANATSSSGSIDTELLVVLWSDVVEPKPRKPWLGVSSCC